MRLKHEHSKHSMSLSAYDVPVVEAASTMRPVVAADEVVTEEGDWLNMTEEQAECQRWGHWEGVLECWTTLPDGSLLRDERGEVVWEKKEYKGECAKCGAKRRVS